MCALEVIIIGVVVGVGVICITVCVIGVLLYKCYKTRLNRLLYFYSFYFMTKNRVQFKIMLKYTFVVHILLYDWHCKKLLLCITTNNGLRF